jgi:hypothetical protein
MHDAYQVIDQLTLWGLTLLCLVLSTIYIHGPCHYYSLLLSQLHEEYGKLQKIGPEELPGDIIYMGATHLLDCLKENHKTSFKEVGAFEFTKDRYTQYRC